MLLIIAAGEIADVVEIGDRVDDLAGCKATRLGMQPGEFLGAPRQHIGETDVDQRPGQQAHAQPKRGEAHQDQPADQGDQDRQKLDHQHPADFQDTDGRLADALSQATGEMFAEIAVRMFLQIGEQIGSDALFLPWPDEDHAQAHAT